MGGKPIKKTPKKRTAAAPPMQTPMMRTFFQARDGMREFAYTAAGCAAILGILMLMHMRPFG
jgi:hypothetical protein